VPAWATRTGFGPAAKNEGITLIYGRESMAKAHFEPVNSKLGRASRVVNPNSVWSRNKGMREPLEQAAGLVYAILFVASPALILGGIWFVYIGASESAAIDLLGLKISAATSGKASIALGAFGLMFLIRMIMRSVQDVL
jgi:hypothetical protein